MLTWKETISEFLDFCRTKNLSHNTVGWYRLRLNYCARELEKKDRTPENTTLSDLREMVSTSLSHLSVITTNHTITAVKTFFKFLTEEGHIKLSPAVRLEKVKGPRKLIDTFTEEQIEALLNVPSLRRFSGIRDKTLMMLLLDTALRIGEATNIRLDDINWTSSYIKVMGKGAKERIVPFGRIVKAQLKTYLERRGDLDIDYLFVGEFGEKFSIKQAQDNISGYGKRAGVTGVRVSPHTFRHTAALFYLRSGGDAFTLQRLLGHTSLDTVKLYINLANDDLQRSHILHSPMDRLSSHETEAKQENNRQRLK